MSGQLGLLKYKTAFFGRRQTHKASFGLTLIMRGYTGRNCVNNLRENS